MPLDAFISYQSADLQQAELVDRKLVEAGFAVWFDKARLNPGCDWHREIEAGCEDSRIVLPVLTPSWQTSDWTKFETYGAEAVIPLLFEGSFAAVAPAPLLRFQAQTINLTDAHDRTDWLRLFGALRRMLADPAPEKAQRDVHLRYRANPYFVGHERELLAICEELHPAPTAALTQGRALALTALGGVGKTTLARQYAEKFWRLYPQMFWVDCRASIDSEFARVGEILVPELRGLDIKDADKARRAIEELNKPPTRLLILDNAEDEDSISARIPKTGGCRTIVTSRFAGWSAALPKFEVWILEPEPARELLCRRGGRHPHGDELEACDGLAKRLDYLPLALEQAAAYIAEQGAGFEFIDYLRLYEHATRELLAKRVLGSTQYPDAVVTTWNTSVQKMEPVSRSILRLAAFLAPTRIPVEMFVRGASIVRDLETEFPTSVAPSETSHSESAEFCVRDGLGKLARYSLIKLDGHQFSVHSLLQTVERLDVAAPRRPWWIERAGRTLGEYLPPNAHLFENWTAWNSLLPHADTLWEEAQADRNVELSLHFLRALCGAHIARGEHEVALPVARKALDLSDSQLGTEHPDTLLRLIDLAVVHYHCGHWLDAEQLLLRGLDACERVLGKEHLYTIASMKLLGSWYSAKGRFDLGVPLLRQALQISQRVIGEEHYETLQIAQFLADALLRTWVENDEAELLLRRALEVSARVLGEQHPDTLDAMSLLADGLRRKGATDEAERLIQDAARVAKRVLGKQHPRTLVILNGLALVLGRKGAHAAAERLHRRVLTASRRVLGHQHPVTLMYYRNLAEHLRGQGAYGKAEACSYRRCRPMVPKA